MHNNHFKISNMFTWLYIVYCTTKKKHYLHAVSAFTYLHYIHCTFIRKGILIPLIAMYQCLYFYRYYWDTHCQILFPDCLYSLVNTRKVTLHLPTVTKDLILCTPSVNPRDSNLPPSVIQRDVLPTELRTCTRDSIVSKGEM